MRTSASLSLPMLLLVAGCGETEIPSGRIYFTPGAEASSLTSVVKSYVVERIDTKGNATTLFEGEELPKKIDMGKTGTYRFRATGKDEAGNPIARGESVAQDVHELASVEIPIFIARLDRTSIADNEFDLTPGEYPKVGLVGRSALWLFTQPNEDIAIDAYNIAYWQQVTPGSYANWTSITCDGGCDLQTLAMVGGTVAFAIGNDATQWFDEYAEVTGQLPLPEGLESFASIAGGRAFPGANYTAVVVGATRKGTPTTAIMAFTIKDGKVVPVVNQLATARAEAAALFEVNLGLVVAAGSSEGSGVERLAPGGAAFDSLKYPADPVSGATLIVDDPTRVLRAGGVNPDGSAAPTVRIDVACALDVCAVEPLDGEPLGIVAAQSFYDGESHTSIVVGEDADGVSKMFRYDPASQQFTAIDVPSNQTRIHATAVQLPGRKVALVGGLAPDGNAADRKFLSVVSF